MEKEKGTLEGLLSKAGAIPEGVTVEDFNPLENIPTLTLGEDFVDGQTVAGWFEETQVLASHKFKFSQEKNAEGVPTSRRHVLRIGSPTGERLAIWSSGELRNTFEKVQPGQFIAITYKGKGMNANNQQQHFFDYKRGAAN